MGYKMKDNPPPECEDFGLTKEECLNIELAIKVAQKDHELLSLKRCLTVIPAMIACGLAAAIWYYNRYQFDIGFERNFVLWMGLYIFTCSLAYQVTKPTNPNYNKIPKHDKYSSYKLACDRHFEMSQIAPVDDDPLFGYKGRSDD